MITWCDRFGDKLIIVCPQPSPTHDCLVQSEVTIFDLSCSRHNRLTLVQDGFKDRY